ncbi:MAG: hydrogen gas-evolving membrane-bound hydrogenase subunit E [Coriobacteriia bacterium]|nr:hydrogen gas-evolving membrane-bound hydrogenase subunit E [Coriobacteriia bacterium]
MNETTSKGPVGLRMAAASLSLILFAFLARAVLAIPETEAGLAPLIDANLADSGVSNAVTAVLLNFRGYDTLLEIVVLVLATIGVLSLRTETAGIWAPLAPPQTLCFPR